MELGLDLPQIGGFGSAATVATVAREAEAIGFDSLWVADRLLRPVAPRDPYPGTPDGSWPPEFATCLDPIETLTFAAAHTDHVALGTSVLNVPWYRPALLARRLATLDVLSGGRLRLGVGLGWSRDEFEALGIPMERLGDRLDDHLDALVSIWAADTVSHAGNGYRIAPCAAGPRPLQRPRPPLYLGAFTERGLRRVAWRADGWLTVFLPPEVMAAMFAQVRRFAEEAGRDPTELRWIVRANPTVTDTPVARAGGDKTFVGTVEQLADEVKAYADLGVDELHLDLQYSPGIDTAATMLDAAHRIHERVAPALDRERLAVA